MAVRRLKKICSKKEECPRKDGRFIALIYKKKKRHVHCTYSTYVKKWTFLL
jgi:hypothetical protein